MTSYKTISLHMYWHHEEIVCLEPGKCCWSPKTSWWRRWRHFRPDSRKKHDRTLNWIPETLTSRAALPGGWTLTCDLENNQWRTKKKIYLNKCIVFDTCRVLVICLIFQTLFFTSQRDQEQFWTAASTLKRVSGNSLTPHNWPRIFLITRIIKRATKRISRIRTKVRTSLWP